MLTDKDYNLCFQQLALVEGLYSNDKGDPGGETILGVSKHFWPKDFEAIMTQTTWTGKMCVASRFYRREFWAPLELDKLNNRFVAYELFEIAVNCGLGASQSVKKKVIQDFGATELSDILVKYPAILVVVDINMHQWELYREIVRKNPSMQRFFNGWTVRLFDTVPEIVKATVQAAVVG